MRPFPLHYLPASLQPSCSLVECISGTRVEEVDDEEELVGGRVGQVLHLGPNQDLERKPLALRRRHVHKYGFALDLNHGE